MRRRSATPLPTAEIAFDPFHVVRLAQRAVDQVRRDEWNAHERSHTPTGRWIKGTRWSLLKAPDKQIITSSRCSAKSRHANQRALPRLPAQGRAPPALPARRPAARARAPRRLAGLGIQLPAAPVRPRSPHDPQPPRRHPRRHPPRPHQRPPRGPQQPHPPDQPPQLRLSLRRPPDRPRLPLLHRHRDRAPAMTLHHRITRSTRSTPSVSRPAHHANAGVPTPSPARPLQST